MNNRQSTNYSPDDRDHSTASGPAAETTRQSDTDAYYDDRDGYDDGLVHSHGWATSDR